MSFEQRRELYLKLIEKEDSEKAIKVKKMEESNHTWKSLIEKSQNTISVSNPTTNSFWNPTEKGKASFKINSTFSDVFHKAFRSHNQQEGIKADEYLDKDLSANVVFKPIKDKLSLSRLYANDQNDCVATFSPTMAYKLAGKDPLLLSAMYSRTIDS